MIYTSEAIERIVKSPSARRTLDWIAPVYGGAENFLEIVNAIGMEVDARANLADSFWNEVIPKAATWSLPLWEAALGIARNGELTLSQRRAKVMARMERGGAMTPARMRRLCEAFLALSVRIEEFAGPNRFDVWVSSLYTDKQGELTRLIDRVKPAHMGFAIRFEQFAAGAFRFGGIITEGKYIAVRQVN